MAIVIRFKTRKTFEPGMYVYEPKTNEWSDPVAMAGANTDQPPGPVEPSPPVSSPLTEGGAPPNQSSRPYPASAENTGGRFGRYLDPPLRAPPLPPPAETAPAVPGSRIGAKMNKDQRVVFNNTVLMSLRNGESDGTEMTTSMVDDAVRVLPFAPTTKPGLQGRLEKLTDEGFLEKRQRRDQKVPIGYIFIWGLTARGREAEKVARKMALREAAPARQDALRSISSPRPHWSNILSVARIVATSAHERQLISRLQNDCLSAPHDTFTPTNSEIAQLKSLLERDPLTT